MVICGDFPHTEEHVTGTRKLGLVIGCMQIQNSASSCPYFCSKISHFPSPWKFSLLVFQLQKKILKNFFH